MGTRADFYVGPIDKLEWLGSTAWDGYPDGVFQNRPWWKIVTSDYVHGDLPVFPYDELEWRAAVVRRLDVREDGTIPKMGWPWPWADSRTTDYAYTFDGNNVLGSCFGGPWFIVAIGMPHTEDECDDIENCDADHDENRDGLGRPSFPDMTERQNVAWDRRSGLMFIQAVQEES